MSQSTLGNTTVNMAGSVRFSCPQCRNAEIVRTRNEREIVAQYVCPQCGFTGPN